MAVRGHPGGAGGSLLAQGPGGQWVEVGEELKSQAPKKGELSKASKRFQSWTVAVALGPDTRVGREQALGGTARAQA